MRLLGSGVLLSAAFIGAVSMSFAAFDGIALTVARGAAPGQVALQYTGNQPTFQMYRSVTAATVSNPANLIAETDTRSFVDSPPAGNLFFYVVLRKPDPLAAMTDGAPDRLRLIGTVVGPAGPFEGEVLVEGNVITCVAPSCSGQPGASGATLVQTNGIILPGLIDTHSHGLFNAFDETDWTPPHLYGNHNQWPTDARYRALIDAKQYLNGEGGSPADLGCEMDKYAEIKALIAGTTSFVLAGPPVRACYASLVRTVDTIRNDLGADKIQTADLMPTDSAAQSVCNNFTSGATDAYLIHIGEGVDASALSEFATLTNRAGGCLLSNKTAIVHGTALGSFEFGVMASHGMKLVWSPKSNLSLYGATTRIDLAVQAGVSTIALAPEWSITGSVNLLDELRVADQVDQTTFGDILTPERLFRMVTIDAARVLALDGALGSLEVGKRADITVIGGYRPAPYDALLLATPVSVRLVMVDGRVLYGDAQLVSSGSDMPGCEVAAVCGTGKFLCAAEDSTADKLNQTYSDILQALADGLTSYDALNLTQWDFSPISPLTRCP